jgi:hypothetical protein
LSNSRTLFQGNPDDLFSKKEDLDTLENGCSGIQLCGYISDFPTLRGAASKPVQFQRFMLHIGDDSEVQVVAWGLAIGLVRDAKVGDVSISLIVSSFSGITVKNSNIFQIVNFAAFSA